MDELSFARAMIAADKEGIITGNDLLKTAIEKGVIKMREALSIIIKKNALEEMQKIKNGRTKA